MARKHEQTKDIDTDTGRDSVSSTDPSFHSAKQSQSEYPALKAEEQAEPATEQDGYIKGTRLWIVLGSVTSIMFLVMLDNTIIATATPRITSDFHSLRDVGWYGSAYLLSSATLQPLTGKIYTMFHTKWVYFSFLMVFEVGSALCGVAQSSIMLILGRTVAGLGGAGLSTGTLTILSASVPIHKRPAYLGVMIAIAQLGTISGPVLGGLFTQYTTWRWCFLINLPAGGLVAMLLILIKIADTDAKNGRDASKSSFKAVLTELDLGGFVIFGAFAVMVLLALQWGGSTYAWSNSMIIGLFVGGGCAFFAFAAYEYRLAERAMIPWHMIKQRVMYSSGITTFLLSATILVNSYYTPIYFQTIRGVGPALSGAFILPTVLGQMLAAAISGILITKLGYYLPWAILCAILASLGGGLMSMLTLHSPPIAWILFQFLGGLGRGCGSQIPLVAVQNLLPASEQPTAMAICLFLQTFGGAVFISLGDTILHSSLKTGLVKYAPRVNQDVVIAAGATGVRGVVSAADLPGVLQAYCKAVNHEYYLATATAALSGFTCLGMGWEKIRKESERCTSLVEED